MTNNVPVSFDQPPINEPITKTMPSRVSSPWELYFATQYQILTSFLGPFGIFAPPITTVQRDSIQSPVLGQIIYNTTTNTLQVWQTVAMVNQWVSFS